MERDNIYDFFIQADNGEVYLKIDAVFGFPDKDTQSRIEIKSGKYAVRGQVFISTGDVYNSFNNLRTVIRN